MALEAVVTVFAEPFMNYVVSPVIRHISYAFRCESKVKKLQDKVEKLKNKRFERQQLADNATRNGEEIFPAVTEWLTAARNEIDEAEKLIQGKAQAMNKCCMGICPNLKTRYQLSKKANKKALAVSEHLEEAGSDPISFRPPLQPIIEPSVYSDEALPSRVLILDQIMEALNDPKLNLIGVYGMGGVGKTTLAKEVKGRASQEKSPFETAVLVAVSQTPDLRRIQGEIADSLGLKYDEEEIPGRASRLRQRLEKEKALIILDDVWEKLDLNSIGVPFGCKILLTSRRKEVCNEMHTQKEFSLDVLREGETWRLFEMSVSKGIDPELQDIAREIAKKCAGLPLLILKVAADLKNKESYVWNDMLNRLSDVESTDIYKKVHGVIESSYDNLLDEDTKSVFLLCALFGDSNIEIHKLVMYSVGLRLFKRIDSIEGVRNRVLSLIDKLKSECLLLNGDRAGFAKIHDVVRDIAVVIASRVQNAFVGAGKVKPVDLCNADCTRISLPYCDLSELPGVLECPKAEVFSLFGKGDHLDIPGSSLEGASKLKVVDFTGVRFLHGLPSSLSSLRGLQTLCLQRCKFDNMAILAELKQLELLSFSGSKIKDLPGEIKGLTRLKLLDLTACRKLEVIPAGVLSSLSSLEELYILNSFCGWEAEGNASLAELKNLARLKTLEIQVRQDELSLQDWFFDGVQNYRISIGYWDDFEDETSRRILKLELKTSAGLMNRIKEFTRGIEVLELRDVKGVENLLYDSVMKKTDCGVLGIGSFGKLQILKIAQSDTLRSLFSHSFAKYLPQLQELELSYCGNMEAIAGEGCRDEVIEFTQLTSLKLKHLPKFIGFCKTSGMVSFPKLESLVVSECNSLKYIFTPSMVESLKQLNQLQIVSCESMEEIIRREEKAAAAEELNIDKIVFPKLECLRLEELQLTRFSSGYPICFPSLKEFNIYECRAIEKLVSKLPNGSKNNESDDKYSFLDELVTFSNLKHLYICGLDKIRYIWSENMKIEASNLKNLDSVIVSNCRDLKYMFSASVACVLQLRKLVVKDCGAEVIIGMAKDEAFEWPNLTYLQISRCPNLINISSNNSKVTFYNLETLYVQGMNKLRSIWNEDINIGSALSLNNLRSVSFECLDLKCVFPVCGLPQLRTLSIVKCGAEVIFRTTKDESSECPNLERLEVEACKDLKYVFTNSMAKSLEKLQVLQISDCKLMEEIILSERVEAENINTLVFPELFCLQLKNLPNLKGFNRGHPIDFPSLRVLESNNCESVDEYLFTEMVTMPMLEDVRMRGMNKLRYIWHEDINIGPGFSLDNLRSVHINECPYLKCVFPVCRLPRLKNLKIEKCGVEVIIGKAEDEMIEIDWSNLSSLELSGLPNLVGFCEASGKGSFPSLTGLLVSDCDGLRYVFTNSMAKSLTQLKKIEISGCKSMEEIILSEEIEEENTTTIVFPKLVNLQLKNLQHLKRFSSRHPIEFPSLRELSIDECSVIENFVSKIPCRSNGEDSADEYLFNEMVTFSTLRSLLIDGAANLKYIWDDLNSALNLCSLQLITISNCLALKYVFPASMARGLRQLQTLEISLSGVEAIFGKAEEDTIEWPDMTELVAVGCHNLSIFRSRNYKVFSNLEELVLDIKFMTEILQFEPPATLLSKVKKLGLGYVSSSTMNIHASLLRFLALTPNLDQLEISHSSVKELFKFRGLNGSCTKEAMTKLPRIRELKLQDLDDMKQIWWQNSEFGSSLFQSLENLQVQSCGEIICLAPGTASFQHMKELEIDGCNQMRYVMTSPVAKGLVRLEKFRVKSCKMLTEIVADGTADEIIFTELHTLELLNLQSLTSFSSGHYSFKFPCMGNFTAHKCPNLRIFCPGEVLAPMLDSVRCKIYITSSNISTRTYWSVGFDDVEEAKLSIFPILKEKWAAEFPFDKLDKLKRLKVDDCTQLTTAISSNILPHLSNLEVLVVDKCNSIENVFDVEEAIPYQCSMEKLNELHLIDLPRLRNVWSKDPREILSFENLRVLHVENCVSLTFIFNLTIASSLSNLQHLQVTNCCSVEYIIADGEDETMQQYEMIFPSLQTMKLKNLTRLLSFYSMSEFLEFPSITYIEVLECPKTELCYSVPPKVQDLCSMSAEGKEEKIEDRIVPLLGNMIVVPKLEALKVEWKNLTEYLNVDNQLLSSLRFIDLTGFEDEYAIVPSNTLQHFPNADMLIVSDASMEEMNLDELSISKDKHNDEVSSVKKLMLINLPKLKHLVRDDSQHVPLFKILVELEVYECSSLKMIVPPSVSFRNLTVLVVSKCDRLKNIINASTAKSLVQLRGMVVRDCKTIQEIVAVGSDEAEYEIRFSQLEHLELDDLPCLTSFCSGGCVFHFPSLEEVVVIKCPNMKTFSEQDVTTPKLKKVKAGRQEYEWEWEGSLNNTIKSLYEDQEN